MLSQARPLYPDFHMRAIMHALYSEGSPQALSRALVLSNTKCAIGRTGEAAYLDWDNLTFDPKVEVLDYWWAQRKNAQFKPVSVFVGKTLPDCGVLPWANACTFMLLCAPRTRTRACCLSGNGN